MSIFRLRTLLMPLVVLLVAGCGGGSSSSSSTATPVTTPGAVSPAPLTTPTPPATPVITGSVAAIVNGHSIPISRYRLLLNLRVRSTAGQPGSSTKQVASQTLDEVIFDELIREYAAAHHISVPPSELAAQLKKDQQQAGGVAQFQSQLTRLGLTIHDYNGLVEPNLLAQKVENQVAPAKAAHTDAQAKALAQQLLTQLQHGANFAALAKKYSDDPGSGAKGGDLGEIRRGQTVPPFEHAAFGAPLNKPVIVKSEFGYHIVEVLARTPASPGKPASAHVRHILISTQLQPQAQQAQRTKFLAWLHQQEKKASIKRVAQVK